MTYPSPTPDQLDFFRQHGWLVVADAIAHAALDELERRCERIITEKESLAYDWAWDAKETKALLDKGITCWIPLHDVDARNGCMHFIDGGHLDGVLEHRPVDGVQSDLITCDVDESRTIVCPLRRGAVTFHHSKTPHMTTANTSDRWRKAVSNHLQAVGAGGEGDHYPWRVCVNQRTGERSTPGR